MSESLNVSVGVCVHGDGIVALRLHELMNLCEHLMHASLLCRFEGWQTEMPEYNKRRSQCPNVVSAYLPQEYGYWESKMCRIINSKYLIDFNTWPFFRLFTLHSISIEWPNDSILFSAHNHYRNDILVFCLARCLVRITLHIDGKRKFLQITMSIRIMEASKWCVFFSSFRSVEWRDTRGKEF